jgi:hypothetical protein
MTSLLAALASIPRIAIGYFGSFTPDSQWTRRAKYHRVTYAEDYE